MKTSLGGLLVSFFLILLPPSFFGADFNLVTTLAAPGGLAASCTMHVDELYIYGDCHDHQLLVWNRADFSFNTELYSYHQMSFPFFDTTFSDNDFIYNSCGTASATDLYIWNKADFSIHAILEGLSGRPTALFVDSDYLYVGTVSNLYIFNKSDYSLQTQNAGEIKDLYADENYLFAADLSDYPRVYSIPDFTLQTKLPIGPSQVNSIYADSGFIYTGGTDGNVYVWNYPDFTLQTTLSTGKVVTFLDICSDPQNRYIFSSYYQNGFSVWNRSDFSLATDIGTACAGKAVAADNDYLFFPGGYPWVNVYEIPPPPTPIPTPQIGTSTGCLSFDGIDDYVEVPHSDALNLSTEVTLEGWVKLSSIPETSFRIMGKHVPYTGYHFAVDTTVFGFAVADGSPPERYAYSTITLNIGDWIHLAGTFDGATVKIYVNGVLEGATDYAGPIGTTTNVFALGNFGWGGPGMPAGCFFHGLIDDVSVYNTALSAEQIAAIYNCKDHPLGSLVAHWTFNEGSGGTLIDSAGANDGTLIGPAWSLDHRPNDLCASPTPFMPPMPTPVATPSIITTPSVMPTKVPTSPTPPPTVAPTAPVPPTPIPAPTPLPPRVQASADPYFGYAPLAVDFDAAVSGGSAIQIYKWDYNNDGVWDYISAQSPQTSHTYSAEGTYQAVCRVVDSMGRTAQDSVTINVYPASQPPIVQAAATPTSGEAPLSVSFSGTVQSVNQILCYLWDFEDDGIVDWGSTVSASTTHIYGEAGSYTAELTVIDEEGLTGSDSVNIQVSSGAPPPQALADATPLTGQIPLIVTFIATGLPAENIILYEWDFDGDGAYDWSSQSDRICTHTYELIGDYDAELRVTDSNNLTGKDMVRISVTSPSQLIVWISTPKDGWTVQGNAVTIRVNTAPGSITKWVQPQYKAAADSEWTDMTGPIYPPPYSFYCTWDTTSLTDDNYNLRSKASDTSDNIVYSDVITVEVDNGSPDPSVEEGTDPQGNHEKRQKTSQGETSLVEIAGGTTMEVPYGALDQNAITILKKLANNPHAGKRSQSVSELFDFTSFDLDGVTGLRKPGSIFIPYDDVNDDGIVDGENVPESSLKIFKYNGSASEWQVLPGCTVFIEENYVQARIMSVGDYALGVQYNRPTKPIIGSGDYDGDSHSDIAVYRPSTGLWAVRGLGRLYYGSSGDIPVSGDYDGDGSTDIALFRPDTGMWAIKDIGRLYFGISGDMPVPGDYNGDGTCDAAIFRSSSGLWAAKGVTRAYFGNPSDQPVPEDYNKDGALDIGIFRPSSGLWAIREVTRVYFGSSLDVPVPGRFKWYSGAEIAVFRYTTGLWAIRDYTRCYYGSGSDIPVPADFGDSYLDDIAIFRSSAGLWAVRGITRAYYGSSGDIPVTR